MGDEATPSLGPSELAERLEAEDIQLVDVREPFEWEAGRIVGSEHIPLSELPSKAESVDRDRPVVFLCRSGSRSAMATQAFREAGFEAANLEGGLTAWVESGLPLEPEDGEVAGPRPDAG